MATIFKVGRAKVEMRSDPNGKCLYFGKIRCIHKKHAKDEKALTKPKRCDGMNPTCPHFSGESAFLPKYDDRYLLPREAETVAFALAGGDNMLLTGVPGAGKTSLVKQMAAILNWGTCAVLM